MSFAWPQDFTAIVLVVLLNNQKLGVVVQCSLIKIASYARLVRSD
jgi:ABC-type dipeptide/oligopeptide/nickel transport system permease subunit